MMPRGEVGLIFVAAGAQLELGGQPLLSPAIQAGVVGALLLTTIGTGAINYAVYGARMPYRPADLTAVGLMTRVANVLMVANRTPIRTLADLVRMAKEQPDTITYSTAGYGSSSSSGSGSGGSGSSGDLGTLSYQLMWIKNTEFAGQYVADTNGYYEGFDKVELIAGGPTVTIDDIDGHRVVIRQKEPT